MINFRNFGDVILDIADSLVDDLKNFMRATHHGVPAVPTNKLPVKKIGNEERSAKNGKEV
jgi:hypothetical protein